MKKASLILIAFTLFTVSTFAQKYVYIDSKYILEQVPEYEEAQTELNTLSKKWQEEIGARYADIEKKKSSLKTEEILLPEESRKVRQNEISALEKEARELQKKHFGVDGDLFKKRQELIQPIQDKIFEAIKEIAEDSNYGFVFDKANGANIMYAQSKLNVSDRVLRKMGYTPAK